MKENTALPAGGPEREFHAVANLFPLMQGAAFDELVADIKKNGQREPILCDAEGRILDGRNRYRACRRAGVEPRFVTWDGEGSPAEVALSLNLRRRHLGESQRALVAARWVVMQREQPKGRPKKGAILHPFPAGKLAEQAAATVNVSIRLVNLALKVVRGGSEGLIAAVESDAVTVSTAVLLTGLPREEQEQLLASGPEQVARARRRLQPSPQLASLPVAVPPATPPSRPRGHSASTAAINLAEPSRTTLDRRSYETRGNVDGRCRLARQFPGWK